MFYRRRSEDPDRKLDSRGYCQQCHDFTVSYACCLKDMPLLLICQVPLLLSPFSLSAKISCSGSVASMSISLAASTASSASHFEALNPCYPSGIPALLRVLKHYVMLTQLYVAYIKQQHHLIPIVVATFVYLSCRSSKDHIIMCVTAVLGELKLRSTLLGVSRTSIAGSM